MTYKQAVEYLYSATPQFQQIGAAAYKPGLDTVKELSAFSGDSHKNYPTIHVAGTNGKGSTAHSLAAILQSAGYRTGLFTSPHLNDFRERIRINGAMVSEEDVVSWLEKYKGSGLSIEPSFFELTTVMAFDLFAKHKVDVAVIEVGLGGRLDSTNIIAPILSIITNISKDHVAQLGNSLVSIAREKAGIIKENTPVILGEGDITEVRTVIEEVANGKNSTLTIAGEMNFPHYERELRGEYQDKNEKTILAAVNELRRQGWKIPEKSLEYGLLHVGELTGLTGRWKQIDKEFNIVIDTGHNEGAWQYLPEMINSFKGKKRMVIGFVNDKDVDSILELMPRDAEYYLCRASVPRALDENSLLEKALRHGLHGRSYPSVNEALSIAKEDSRHDLEDSIIFVGGSTFVVADALK